MERPTAGPAIKSINLDMATRFVNWSNPINDPHLQPSTLTSNQMLNKLLTSEILIDGRKYGRPRLIETAYPDGVPPYNASRLARLVPEEFLADATRRVDYLYLHLKHPAIVYPCSESIVDRWTAILAQDHGQVAAIVIQNNRLRGDSLTSVTLSMSILADMIKDCGQDDIAEKMTAYYEQIVRISTRPTADSDHRKYTDTDYAGRDSEGRKMIDTITNTRIADTLKLIFERRRTSPGLD